MNLTTTARFLARAFAIGLVAGVAVFLVDIFLAWTTLGYRLPIRLGYVLWYTGAGVAAALLVAAGWRAFRRRLLLSEWLAATVAAAYLPAITERAFTALQFRTGDAVAFLGATVAAVGYGLWISLLVRIAGRAAGPWIGALAVALALALNRNVIALPTEPLALLADAAVVAAALIAALSIRKLGTRPVAMTAAALALLAFAATILPAWLTSAPAAAPAPDREPDRATATTAGDRPNLLLVVIDTLRADVFESVVEETEEGRAFREALGAAVSFRNMTAAAPWTPPSVGSIMTGLYPREHGFDRVKGSAPGRPLRKLDTSLTTVAEHFHDHGYVTAAIATNPFLNRESGIMQGFEHGETLEAGTAKLPLMTALQELDLVDTELYQDAARVHRRLVPLAGILAEDERPYFLWLHLMDPHMPLRAHRDLGVDDSTEPGSREDRPEVDRLYRDETRFALRELAWMFELLKKRGLWDDTAVVVVADHGEMMLSDRRFRGRKRRGKANRPKGHGHALFDELVRVPLVIRPAAGPRQAGPRQAGPRQAGPRQAGAIDRQVDVLASHVDLAHTLADLAGIERMRLPGGRVSLAPWLDESAAEPGRPRTAALVGSTHYDAFDQRGLRTPRYKLIEYLEGDLPPELYDLSRDAAERRNLAERRPKKLAKLSELLARDWNQMVPAPDAEAVEMDEEERKRLEALGYL